MKLCVQKKRTASAIWRGLFDLLYFLHVLSGGLPPQDYTNLLDKWSLEVGNVVAVAKIPMEMSCRLY